MGQDVSKNGPNGCKNYGLGSAVVWPPPSITMPLWTRGGPPWSLVFFSGTEPELENKIMDVGCPVTSRHLDEPKATNYHCSGQPYKESSFVPILEASLFVSFSHPFLLEHAYPTETKLGTLSWLRSPLVQLARWAVPYSVSGWLQNACS